MSTNAPGHSLDRGDAPISDQASAPAQPATLEPPRKSPYSRQALLGRMLWGVARASAWKVLPGSGRNWLLRAFGARIGLGVRIHRSVAIEIPWNLTIGEGATVCPHAILYCLGPVRIGARCVIGRYVHVCAGTHDFSDPRFTLLRSPITIEDDCMLMTASFVGPDTTIARGSVLRPRATVFGATRPDTTYEGTPARPIEGSP